MRKILILFITLLTFGSSLAQKNDLKLNAGYGIWQGFHKGFDLMFSNFSMGMDIGSSFNTGQLQGESLTLAVDNQYYFGKKNRFKRKNWSIASRVVYWYLEDSDAIWNTFQLCPAVARNLQLSKKLGLTIDAGPSILLYTNKEEKNKNAKSWLFPIMPEVKIQFFRFPSK